MNAGVHHGHIYYRCAARGLPEPPADHPPTVYLRQDALTAPVTAFLRRAGHPLDAAEHAALPNGVSTHEGFGSAATAARQAEAYVRRGLRLTYHPDWLTVVLTIPTPPPNGHDGEPTVQQAEFVVG